MTEIHINEPLSKEYEAVSCEMNVDTPVINQIVFCVDSKEWLIKITKDGILFNRETYPDSKPDDFAQAFIDILEKSLTISFQRKSNQEEK